MTREKGAALTAIFTDTPKMRGDGLDGRPPQGLPPRAAAPPHSATVVFGRWEINPTNRTFKVDGEPIALTRTEFDLVRLLVAHPGRAFARSELLRLVNGDDRPRDDKTSRAHIGNIRSKLRPTGTSDYIETVWGFGFRLTEHPR